MQISESFNRFGVTDASQHLLVACFDAKADQVGVGACCTLRCLTLLLHSVIASQDNLLLHALQLEAISAQISGSSQPLDKLSKVSNTALISKVRSE